MIQFARVIGFEVSLATLGMLEDALLKNGGKTEKRAGDKGSGQIPSFNRAGSTVVESVVSLSFHSLTSITESFGSDPSAGDTSQQSRSSRQADAALGFSQTQVIDITGSDSMRFVLILERRVICMSGQGKVGLIPLRPVDLMMGVSVH